MVRRENKKQRLCKIWGGGGGEGDKEYYGIFPKWAIENGVLPETSFQYSPRAQSSS